MKTFPIFLSLLLATMPSVVLGCECGGDVTDAVPAGHPLKGVIIDVLPDQSALLVKHEEIPGVMKAMTMLLKVDADALASVKKGDAVTGLLVRQADGWWLEAVKVIK